MIWVILYRCLKLQVLFFFMYLFSVKFVRLYIVILLGVVYLIILVQRLELWMVFRFCWLFLWLVVFLQRMYGVLVLIWFFKIVNYKFCVFIILCVWFFCLYLWQSVLNLLLCMLNRFGVLFGLNSDQLLFFFMWCMNKFGIYMVQNKL